jgi:hypothetical protein
MRLLPTQHVAGGSSARWTQPLTGGVQRSVLSICAHSSRCVERTIVDVTNDVLRDDEAIQCPRDFVFHHGLDCRSRHFGVDVDDEGCFGDATYRVTRGPVMRIKNRSRCLVASAIYGRTVVEKVVCGGREIGLTNVQPLDRKQRRGRIVDCRDEVLLILKSIQ